MYKTLRGALVLMLLTVSLAAQNVVGDEACPNRQWTPEVLDVDFSSGTISIIQGGVVVLQQALGL
jgi:hypothetical protein